TTYALLVEEAYDQFVHAVTAAVSQSATPTIRMEHQCYQVNSSVSQLFPVVSFNFKGGASLVLTPEQYLVQSAWDVAGMWCLGFWKNPRLTVLGDLVLKDRIFVYDLVHQQIGWANYNCASTANVSISREYFVNPAQWSSRSWLPLAINSVFLFVTWLR
ncbi:unnamed protein product, partial [Linum tenue]